MESRLIYIASERAKSFVAWPKLSDSEWVYFGAAGEVIDAIVTENINAHFTGSMLYVSLTRQRSFESKKEEVLKAIKNILGSENFTIWNSTFTEAIEFDKIGVLRLGKRHLQ